jgi:hypothetical protein
MRHWLTVGLAVVAILAVTGVVLLADDEDRPGHEDRSRICTLIGCSNAAFVLLEDAAYLPDEVGSVRLCVAGRCASAPRDSLSVDLPLGEEYLTRRPVQLRLDLLDVERHVLRSSVLNTRVQRSTPNGEGCGECFSVGATMRADGTLIAGRIPLKAPEGAGLDVISAGHVARFGDADTQSDVALPLVPGGEIEVRSQQSLDGVRVTYGTRGRFAWDLARDNDVTRGRVLVPPRKAICALTAITIHTRHDTQRRAVTVAVTTDLGPGVDPNQQPCARG